MPLRLCLDTYRCLAHYIDSGALDALLSTANANASIMPMICSHASHNVVSPRAQSPASVRRTYCEDATDDRADAREELEQAFAELFDAEHDGRERVRERHH